MSLLMLVLVWLARGLAVVLFAGTVIPFLHTGSWLVRGFDFPRLQMAALCAGLALAIALVGGLSDWRREPWFWMGLCVLLAAWHGTYVVRFTAMWPVAVPDAEQTDLSLVVANLDFRNDDRAAALEVLQGLDADAYLLIEVDRAWLDALAPLRDAREHRLEAVRDEGLGIVLWSATPLRDAEIEHLVSDRRPSLHASLTIHRRAVRLVGTHPTPPGLSKRHAEGRHDSRVRDAELLLIAETVAEEPDRAWVVAGDFNDVAWSRTTSLFARRSGLLDPRVGRSLLNTYHARYTLLRYPLDHVFVSPGFRVGAFERVRIPGSDHFAVRVELELPESPEGAEPEGSESQEEADAMIRQGEEDAAENASERRAGPDDKP